MHAFQAVLQNRSWWVLRATAKAHGLHFETKQSRQSAITYIHSQLEAPETFARLVRQLSKAERAALMALKARDGSMPRYEFCAHFGDIRRYRPWRADAPRHPWRHPASVAERLWFLGLVDIRRGENGIPETVYAPREALECLPPLPHPHDCRGAMLSGGASRDHLLTDIAVFLGTLLAERPRPIRGRWLRVDFQRAFNRRCGVRDAPRRSERQSGRLKFLHYLAEVGGLVALQGGALLPTVAAWRWLSASPGARWEHLWGALNRDIRARSPLWAVYRLPEMDVRLWDDLLAQLDALAPGAVVSRASLVACLAPYLPPQGYAGRVKCWLDTVLSWGGIVQTSGHAVRILPRIYKEVQPGTLRVYDGALWLKLAAPPPARPLAELLSFAALDAGEVLRVDAATMRRAVEGGYDALSVADILVAFTGRPLAPPVLDQLGTWARAAERLRLRHVVLLSSPDPDLLASLRQNRHLRGYFTETLAARHVAVHPAHLPELLRKLARRSHPVTVAREGAPRPADAAAAYGWIAGRVLQRLEAFARLPLHYPSAALPGNLPRHEQDALQATVDEIIGALRYALRDPVGFASPVQARDPARIRACLEAAYAADEPVTIDYFSPLEGMTIRRRVTPLTPIRADSGAEYLDAWCELASASRTFRLDRILDVPDVAD